MTFHSQPVKDVLDKLKTNPEKGLSTQDAEALITQYGENRLKEKPKKTNLQRFADQFKDAMILILLAAAAVSFVIACIEGNPMEFFEPAYSSLTRRKGNAAGKQSRKGPRRA